MFTGRHCNTGAAQFGGRRVIETQCLGSIAARADYCNGTVHGIVLYSHQSLTVCSFVRKFFTEMQNASC